MKDQEAAPASLDEAATKKHFETHHAREMVRDPETGELVSSPAEFAANKQSHPIPTKEQEK